ncbi:MAG: hypothetical protein PHD31_03020 [Candidatus Pacebacteria bacterium]|nr:hypothetical protein [Candidatus Paceibacterota bacterium]
MARNPFSFGRIENEKSPVLFMSDDFLDWSVCKSLLFTGPRGSGKSSILKALSWEVTWGFSKTVVTGSSKISKIFSNPTFLGVYCRVEDMDIEYWEQWKIKQNEHNAQKSFGTYLEFLYLDLFLSAIIKLQREKAIFSNKVSEREVVTKIITYCYRKDLRPHIFEESFESLRSLVEETHLGIRDLVFRNISSDQLVDTFPISSPGDLIQYFGQILTKYFPEVADWTFSLLIDDCNCLKEWQAVVINTAVAKAKVPIAYKLSAVEGLYTTRKTLSQTRPLSEHDLETVSIGGGDFPMNKETFLRLAEGVCRTRIERYNNNLPKNRFNFKSFFGSFDLEELLLARLKTSEKNKTKDFLELVKKRSAKTGSLDVTGAWMEKNNIRDFLYEEDAFVKKQNDSKYWKKWNHTAAIALCKEYKQDFPYCSWQVVLLLSARSIREMLRIMSKVWIVNRANIGIFTKKSSLGQEIQTKAIKMAAKASFNAIDTKQLFENTSLPEICERLGNLFSKFQSMPYLLKAPESAAISILKQDLDRIPEIASVVDAAVMAGIMLKKVEKNKVEIALHPILSPRFNFCFRSPFYYSQAVSKDELTSLFTGDQSEAIQITKNILSKRLINIGNIVERLKITQDKSVKKEQQIEIGYEKLGKNIRV